MAGCVSCNLNDRMTIQEFVGSCSSLGCEEMNSSRYASHGIGLLSNEYSDDYKNKNSINSSVLNIVN